MKVYSGHILTVDKADNEFRYLVENGGRIAFVGDALPREYACVPVEELGERALIPAFVDTHQHFASFSLFNAGLNVMEAVSNAQIKEMVRQFAQKEGNNKKTLIAFGASPYSVAERKLVSRRDLDEACPVTPADARRFEKLDFDYVLQLGCELFAEDPLLHRHDPERARRLAWLIAERSPDVNAALFAAPAVGCNPDLVEPRFCALPCTRAICMW